MDLADETTFQLLRRYEVRPDTRVAYLGPVRQLAGHGTAVECGPHRATAGVLVTAGGQEFGTTAGHLGAEVGEELYRLRRRRILSPKRQRWGVLLAATDPEPGDADPSPHQGVDVGIVNPFPEAERDAWGPVNGIADAWTLDHRERVRWNGGVTGHHEGTIVHLATQAAGSPAGWYRNLVLFLPAGGRRAGARGDSGSAAFTRDGRLVGHVVGVEGDREDGEWASAYVQGIDAILPYLSANVGPVDEIAGDLGER